MKSTYLTRCVRRDARNDILAWARAYTAMPVRTTVEHHAQAAVRRQLRVIGVAQ